VDVSDLLSLLGLLGLLASLVGLCRGSVRTVGLSTRPQCARAAGAAVVVMMIGGALAPGPGPAQPRDAGRDVPRAVAAAEEAPAAARTASPPSAPPPPLAAAAKPGTQAAARTAAPVPTRTSAGSDPLLRMASGGDGDSWRDTAGVEYRMGLINTPETGECGGAAATQYRRQALAGGFRARTYASDRYGRKVSVIVAPNGVNLNVAMARDGIADDSYLERFRHENPPLAAQLDAAFREARAADRGIWTTCRSPAAESGSAPQPAAAGGCHPDYATCIPVKGDGSGRGAANDLDCSDLDSPVHLREVGLDPYRLDGSDQDGIGCE
jgi:endonuclease YncB( thermonuclease family)